MKRGELYLTPMPVGHVYEFDGFPRKSDLPLPAKCSRCGALAERVSGLEVWVAERRAWVARSGLHCTRRSKRSSNVCGFFELLEEVELPDKPAPMLPGAAPSRPAPVPPPPPTCAPSTTEGDTPMPRDPEPRNLAELTEEEKAEALSALLEHDVAEVGRMYQLNVHSLKAYRQRIKPGAFKRCAPSPQRLAAVVAAWQKGIEPSTLIDVFGLSAEELAEALAGKRRDPSAAPFVTEREPVASEKMPPEPQRSESQETVDHPPHYTVGGVEAIDVIEAWELDFALGNAVKYIARAGRKGDVLEDLRKAQWYIARAIQRRERAS